MDIAGWGVSFALLFVFIILSFKTWIVWLHTRHEDDELWQKRQELLDSLPPLSNGRKPR